MPLYLQLRETLRGQILSGALPGGSRLPAARALADQLHVSRGTVDTAYAGLLEEGLCQVRRGVGQFVSVKLGGSSAGPQDAPLDWANKITPAARRAAELRIGRQVVHGPRDTISFTSLAPDHRLFEVELFRRCLNDALAREGSLLLGYGYTGGYTPLLEAIGRYLVSKGIRQEEHELLIVNGFRQGLELVTRALVTEGDAVLVETPCYNGAIGLFQTSGAVVLHVPCDEQGMIPGELELLARERRPKLIYAVPTYNNPTGRNMSLERRRALLAVAHRHGIPIIEDGFNEELRYRGEVHPSLAALDGGNHVLYVGSFSKVLFPGLRIGWVRAPKALYDVLAACKYHDDIHTSLLPQAGLAEFMARGGLEKHLSVSRKTYSARLDALHTALRKYMDRSARWAVCDGGFSVWVEFPEHVDTRAALASARKSGVVYAPGDVFFAQDPSSGQAQGRNAIRLGFPRLSLEEIDQGIQRLSKVLPKESGGICISKGERM